MPVDAAKLEEVQRMLALPPEHDAPDLSALLTHCEVLGYTIAAARQEGQDEVEMVELVVRGAEMPPDEVRRSERVLRRLGYTAVCDRLRTIAGRRKHDLAPLSA